MSKTPKKLLDEEKAEAAGTGDSETPVPVDSTPTPGPRRRRGHAPIGGSRDLREYYFNESDLRDISRSNAFATLLFTISTASFGFALNIQKDIAFNPSAAPEVIATWTARQEIAAGICVALFIWASILSISNYNRIEEIKSETTFSDGHVYKPNRRYGVFLTIGLLAAAFVGGYLLRKYGY